MARLSYSLVMKELKQQLKKSKISYARLANLMDVSESTLKKWFLAKDGSFNRINMISETLGIPVHALIRSIEEQNVLTLTMTTAQQSLFGRDPSAFKIYWYLVYERMTADEVMPRLKLKTNEFKALLYKLDKVNLIQLGKGDQLKIPKMRPVRWKFEGPFMEKLLSQWTSELMKEAHDQEEFSRLVLQFFQLSPKSAAEFKQELEELEEKYARRTILEFSTYQGPRKQIRYLLTTAEGSFIK